MSVIRLSPSKSLITGKQYRKMMNLTEFYTAVGGDYTEAVGRIPSDRILRSFVLKFAEDPTYKMLCNALETGDLGAAFRAAHTLKGVAGNLGLRNLAVAASALTEELRGAAQPPRPETVEALRTAYFEVQSNLRRLD